MVKNEEGGRGRGGDVDKDEAGTGVVDQETTQAVQGEAEREAGGGEGGKGGAGEFAAMVQGERATGGNVVLTSRKDM